VKKKELAMTRDQKTVVIGAVSGIATMIAATALIYRAWPTQAGLGDIAGRLAYTLQAEVFAVLPLLIMIIAVGNGRFLSEAIDPTLKKESRSTVINGRVAGNTLEQFILFLVATLALSIQLTEGEMRIVPAATIVFIVARILFWIGYRIHPLYRAFGMAATSYLNVGLLAFALWRIVAG
jgi:uncharacterized MAPEG superfamily protein